MLCRWQNLACQPQLALKLWMPRLLAMNVATFIRNSFVTSQFEEIQRIFVNFGELKLCGGLFPLWVDPTPQSCYDLAFGLEYVCNTLRRHAVLSSHTLGSRLNLRTTITRLHSFHNTIHRNKIALASEKRHTYAMIQFVDYVGFLL